ncbi:MAG: anaerobic sulfatase maturase [Lentisphaeria bacterium]|nr:anaerobic sulfatase maturase [Lentisphaeria bacterium]
MSILTAPQTRPFHVLGKPSGPICNLDCEYCFYLDKVKLFKKDSDFRMSEEVLERHIEKYIEAQYQPGLEINFAWQGGEPTLMGVDWFRKVVEFQEKYAPKDANITNAFQTNGTLLDDEWGKFLHDHKFLVGISIDGPEELHDHFRKNRGGRGTYDQVIKGLRILQKHNVEYNVLTVVQSHNGDHPLKVYNHIKDLGAEFIQFIPIVEPESNNGKVSYRSVGPKQFGKFMITIFDEWLKKDIGKIFIQHFDGALANELNTGGAICVHSPECGRSVAIEHNGNVYSCDHFVFDEYLVGNIMDEDYPSIMDSPKQNKFGKDKLHELPQKCITCPVRQQCHGGCPAHRIKKSEEGKTNLNYLCAGYLDFFSHIKPYLNAMGQALMRRMPATEYIQFMPKQPEVGRNSPCPCGSGKKFKRCCGKM